MRSTASRRRFAGDRHGMPVGVQQFIRVPHDPDMTFPEDQIAALQAGQGRCRCRSARRLSVSPACRCSRRTKTVPTGAWKGCTVCSEQSMSGKRTYRPTDYGRLQQGLGNSDEI